MKREPLSLVGKTFGLITVSAKASRPRYWFGSCACTPDVERELNGSRLAAGRLSHCGCKRVSHGHTQGRTRSPTYLSWQDMRQRCKVSEITEADGTVTQVRRHDPKWLAFSGFLEDMGERPAGTTLDRINPLGQYTKANCRWATRQTQDFNRTDTKIYCADPLRRNWCGSALEWAELITRSTGVKMSISEFETIIKFITPEKLCCTQSAFCTLENMKKLEQETRDRKLLADRAKDLEAERRQREQNVDPFEDTGYVPPDYSLTVAQCAEMQHLSVNHIRETKQEEQNHD